MTGGAAHLADSEGSAAEPATGRPHVSRVPLDWLKRHTGTVGLDHVAVRGERRSPARHPVRDTWITVVAALVVVSTLAVQDWQADRQEPYFSRYLILDVIAGLVLAPLLVATFLTLRSCTAWLLLQLEENRVIDPARQGTGLARFAGRLDRRLDRLVRPAAIATILYLAYTLMDGLDDLDGAVSALLFAIALTVQATLFFVGVLTVLQIWTVCGAVGRLVRQPNVRVWPLHPDGSGGLRPVGRVLGFVLYFAAILGGAGLGMFLALPDTPSAVTRRPEPYLLAAFYAVLLPSALVNVLWRPHRLLVERREALLAPVATAFSDLIGSAARATAADPARLRETTDLLAEISRRGQLLDEASPAWPLPARRLRPMLATAVLPVVIPVASAILTRLLTAVP